MKNRTKISISIFAVAIGSIFTTEYSSSANGNLIGAPATSTGSPGDASSCSSLGCHGAISFTAPYFSPSPTTTVAGLITSTIPAGGYIPGNTYTITGTVTSPGKTRFGFEISPQNTAGTLLGTLTATDTTTHLVGTGNKYITHKQSGIDGTTGSHTWSFDWTAPAAGVGPVTFYGMFMITNNDGKADVGDVLQKSTLLIHEFGTTSIDEVKNIANYISIYPNPISDNFFINNSLNAMGSMAVNISDMNGQFVKKIPNVLNRQSINIDDLAKGVYFLQIETPKGNIVKKIVKD